MPGGTTASGGCHIASRLSIYPTFGMGQRGKLCTLCAAQSRSSTHEMFVLSFTQHTSYSMHSFPGLPTNLCSFSVFSFSALICMLIAPSTTHYPPHPWLPTNPSNFSAELRSGYPVDRQSEEFIYGGTASGFHGSDCRSALAQLFWTL